MRVLVGGQPTPFLRCYVRKGQRIKDKNCGRGRSWLRTGPAEGTPPLRPLSAAGGGRGSLRAARDAEAPPLGYSERRGGASRREGGVYRKGRSLSGVGPGRGGAARQSGGSRGRSGRRRGGGGRGAACPRRCGRSGTG